MKKIISVLLVLIFGISQVNYTNAQTLNKKNEIYKKAGIIKVKDPKAVMVGYRNPGDDIFEISLDDVGKYTGHVCAGIVSGYFLTKNALKELYPNGEFPVRGQVSIVASGNTDQLEVLSYVLRARFSEGEDIEKNSIVIDSSLQTEPGITTLILKRADTGKMVKAVFNKKKLINAEKRKIMMPLKKKIMKGKATKEEKKQFAENVQKIVAQVITNLPEGVITISECNEFSFPE